MNAPLRLVRSLLAAALAVAAGACAAPATVEGVFGGEDFRLDSDAPLSKPTGSGRDMVIVLSQIDSETLSTVSLTLPLFTSLPIGEAVDVAAYGGQQPSLKATVGDLLVEARPDGAEIISSTNARVASAVGGTFTLDDATDTEIAGSFSIDLDDGGFLEGSFVAAPGT